MIIDLILDRKDNESEKTIYVYPDKITSFDVPVVDVHPDVPENLRNGYVYHYTPEAFYREVFQYGEIGHEITAALDYGTEADVKEALCRYIDRGEYASNIKDYINSVNWLDM